MAASRVVVLAVANEPWANTNEPTVTSDRVAVEPLFEYVVDELTTMVAVVLLGPITVMVSPLTAVTLPMTDGCSMSIAAAVVEPAALGIIRTCSPTARSEVLAATRSLVTVVEDVIENTVEVPLGSFTVIEVELTAVTTPPAPLGQFGPPFGAVSCAASLATVLVLVLEVVVVEALATPAPAASAPMATAVEIDARLIIFFFVVRYMVNLSDNTSRGFEM